MPLSTDHSVAHDITLATIAAADGSSVTEPNPQDVAGVTVDNKVTVQTVTTNLDLSYDQVSTSDEVTNESLNRTAETLKASIEGKLAEVKVAMNAALNDIGSDHGEQVTEIQNKFSGLVTGVNQGFAEVRTSAATQTDDILAIVTAKIGEVMTESARVLEVAENSQIKIAALDDTYGTDSEFAARVAQVNGLIDTLAGTDFSFLEALDAALDEMNAMSRVLFKMVSVNSAAGNYSFDLAGEGWPTFGSADDFRVEALSELDANKQMRVSSKTASGFTVSVVSKDTHFLPQPVDCSTAAVPVFVRVTHENQNPLGFSTTRLVDSSGDTEAASGGNE